MHCIVPEGVGGSSVFDRGLTKSMQCIAMYFNVLFPVTFDYQLGIRWFSIGARHNICTVLYPLRVLCGVEGFSGGVLLNVWTVLYPLELGSR